MEEKGKEIIEKNFFLLQTWSETYESMVILDSIASISGEKELKPSEYKKI